MMTEKVEQHICIKFCQKIGHSCSETYNMFQKTSGNEAMGCMQVKEWFMSLKEGWMSVERDEHSGRPSTSRNKLMTDKVRSAMLDNWQITTRELSDELGHSDRRSEHETRHSKICPKTADS
jgi:hypothetical protein